MPPETGIPFQGGSSVPPAGKLTPSAAYVTTNLKASKKQPLCRLACAEERIMPEISPELEAMGADPTEMRALAELVKRRGGIDLFSYKPRLVRRRLLVRIRTRKCRNLGEYLQVMTDDPEEWAELKRALSINVSGFFRNPETFFFLRDRVFPELIGGIRRSGNPLLIVSAGCAEGEEPYSFALLVRHYFAKAWAEAAVRIVGVDMGEDLLRHARKGVYGEDRLSDLPPEIREGYFVRKGREFQLAAEVREQVEFQSHDLREDLSFSGISLLSCRNVLIYYRRKHQLKMLKGFYRSLAENGYLVLGKTEGLPDQLGGGLAAVNVAERVYRKRGGGPCAWR